jgi:copper chaperone NosL
MRQTLLKWMIMGGFIVVIVIIFASLSQQQKMVVLQEGNTDKKPIPMRIGHFQDSDCGMIIDTLEYASQVVSTEGKTWFFHDHGGMVKWLSDKEFASHAVIWVYAHDTKKWIDGRSAWYSRTDKTPMNYGFGAYAQRQEGFIPFEEMRLLMLRGENLTNPYVRKQLGVH